LIWVGFTKIETHTTSARSRAVFTSDRCPSWRAPIVGTSAMRRPAARSASARARNAATVVMRSIAAA
jgi:hypothetical protein